MSEKLRTEKDNLSNGLGKHDPRQQGYISGLRETSPFIQPLLRRRFRYVVPNRLYVAIFDGA
jgi:hypothetical protein